MAVAAIAAGVALGGARAAADPVVAAAGDIACDPGDANFNNGNGTASLCRQKYTALLLSGVDAVLALGDEQYDDGTEAKFGASYDLSWGASKPVTHPAPGNHEYQTAGAAGYFAYFGAAAGDPAKGYYSFDLGSWHLIALNSECAEVGGCDMGSAQELWLAADLAASTKPCTLAYWHRPRFSSAGNNAAFDSLWRDLYAERADIVLVGHHHHYERFALQNPDAAADSAGLREFIVGTGGRSHTGIGATAANSDVRNTNTFGVLELTLHAGSYEWQFVGEGGSISDSGSTSCHNGPTAVLASGLRAQRVGTGVALRWKATDARLLGFDLYRGSRRLNQRLIVRGTWRDRSAPAGATTYRLEAVGVDGRRTSAGQVAVTAIRS